MEKTQILGKGEYPIKRDIGNGCGVSQTHTHLSETCRKKVNLYLIAFHLNLFL